MIEASSRNLGLNNLYHTFYKLPSNIYPCCVKLEAKVNARKPTVRQEFRLHFLFPPFRFPVPFVVRRRSGGGIHKKERRNKLRDNDPLSRISSRAQRNANLIPRIRRCAQGCSLISADIPRYLRTARGMFMLRPHNLADDEIFWDDMRTN